MFFIINPLSGSGRGLTLWKQLSVKLDELDIHYEFALTEFAKHATELALTASLQKIDVLIVLGGDGTLHEAANGLLNNENNITAISVIPVGTGNDFASAYKLSNSIDHFLKRIQQPKLVAQDVIELLDQKGYKNYCISMCGIGFDAFIAREANLKKQHGSRGKLIYIKSALIAVFQYKPVAVQLSYDGKQHRETILTMALGIHKTNGGGLMQCPHAVLNDGLISVTLIKPLSIMDVLRIVPQLFNGKLLAHNKVLSFHTNEIRIEADTEVLVETDGEDAGKLPVSFIVRKKVLSVMV